MNPIPYEGGAINFYPEAAVAMTEAEFIEHEAHSGLSKAKLREAYRLCKKAVEAANKNTEPSPEQSPS